MKNGNFTISELFKSYLLAIRIAAFMQANLYIFLNVNIAVSKRKSHKILLKLKIK